VTAWPPHAAGEAARLLATRNELDEPLTDKEDRIFELIAQGKGNNQIATAVLLGEGTAKNCVSRIVEKLRARSRLELAMRAVHRRT
jgi:DNA-binding NarL/FixJ family response regulator